MENSELDINEAVGREITGLRADRSIGGIELTKTKEKMAQSLLNGLGDTIKQEIREANNAQLEQETEKNNKIREFFKKLFRICS